MCNIFGKELYDKCIYTHCKVFSTNTFRNELVRLEYSIFNNDYCVAEKEYAKKQLMNSDKNNFQTFFEEYL